MLTTYLGPGSSGLSATDPHQATKMKTSWLIAEIAEKCPPPEDKRPADVSWRCWDFLRQLLVPNVHERISVADALAHPWLEESPSQDSSLPSSPGHGGAGCILKDQDVTCLHMPAQVPLKNNETAAPNADGAGIAEASLPAPASCCRSKTAPALRPAFALSPRQDFGKPLFSARMNGPPRTGRISLALPNELDRALNSLAEIDLPNELSSPCDQTTPRIPQGGSVACRAPRLSVRREHPSPCCSPMLGSTDVLSRTMPVRSALISQGLMDASVPQHHEVRRIDPLIRTVKARSPLASPQEQHLYTPRPCTTHMFSRTPMMPLLAPVTFAPATPAPEVWGYASPNLQNVHRRRSLAT